MLGEHPGVQFFTVGQRRGLGLGGNTGSPRYVVRIDAARNRVVLGAEDDLYSTSMWASNRQLPRWRDARHAPWKSQPRSGTRPARPPRPSLPRPGFAQIRFHEPQRAVTPGQAVVFYDGDRLVGGGIIELGPPAAAETPALAEARGGLAARGSSAARRDAARGRPTARRDASCATASRP